MAWNEKNFISLADMYVAYRKAKVDVFYEKTNLDSIAFAKYEIDLESNLRALLQKLSDGDWSSDSALIGSHSFIPKSIDPEPQTGAADGAHFFSSDSEKRWNLWREEQKKKPKVKFRVIGRHTVDFHIISTLWILKVGQFYDACLGPDARGSRLRRYSDIKTEGEPENIADVNPNAVGTFRPYAIDFKNWRSNGFVAIRQALKKHESVVAITMDIRQFYHCLSPEFLLDYDFLTAANLKLSDDQVKFTRQLMFALATWARTARQVDDNNTPIGVPVGLTASKVIANVALLGFDRGIKKELSPIYYGRYVDDVFLVVRDTKEFSSSAEVSEFLAERIVDVERTLQDKGNGNSIRFKPAYDKERSIMEFAGAKQKMFALSGQAGLDLLDGIEQQVNDASSEWRMLADLPDNESDLLKNILCPGRDASLAVDNLRKADGVSVRRLGFSLMLRNLEAIERDLPQPNTWKKQRDTFYDVVFNHILTIPGVFDFFPSLPRLMGLAVASGEIEIALKLIHRFRRVMTLLRQTTTIDPANAIPSCLEYTARAFCIAALQALGPVPRINDDVRNLWGALDSLSDSELPASFDEIASTAHALWVRDLGRQSYRESLMERDAVASAKSARIPQMKFPVRPRERLHVDEVEAFVRAARPSFKSKAYIAALVFPTRPFSPTEVTMLVPETVYKPKKLWRFVKALRGLAIRKPHTDAYSQLPGDYEPKIRLPFEGAPAKPLVALPCLLTHAGSWKASVRRQIDPDNRRYFRINRLINEILRCPKRPHYVIFPELSIPRNWFGRIAYKLAKSGISVVAGLEYEHHGRHLVSNQIWASLVTDVLGYRVSVIYRQDKEAAALHEERELWQQARLRLVRNGKSDKNVILHGQCAFGLLLCSELTDMDNRLCFRGNVDAIFVAEWNQDTKTFASLIEAAALDVHCYMVQVNNHAYGDCRIRVPAKEDYDRDVVRLKGGVTDYFVIGELDVPALREFQSQAQSPDKPFKPVPAGFKIAAFRQSRPPLTA